MAIRPGSWRWRRRRPACRLAHRDRDHGVRAGAGFGQGAHALERLRQLGCRIALDDFGTGYSSLAYITRFPPDRLKIDKAFVRNVDQSASDAAIANAILSLGETLGIVVTAEGVERPGQLEWLRTRGCEEVQGFLLSKPLPAREFERRFLCEARVAAAQFRSAGTPEATAEAAEVPRVCRRSP